MQLCMMNSVTIKDPDALAAVKLKRIRRQPDEARSEILDATEKLILEEGYASVSTRRVAKELNVTGAAIHHYFATTDDLFIELHERYSAQHCERLRSIQNAPDPMQALWELLSLKNSSTLGVEFFAAANHRKGIRDQIIATAEEGRRIQASIISEFLEGSGIGSQGAAALLTAITSVISNEGALGMTLGHDEMREIVEQSFTWLKKRKD